jgi:hypothetical protein
MGEVDKGETVDDFTKLAEEMTGKPQTEEAILAERAKHRNLADAEELFAYAIQKKKLELPSIGAYVEYMPLRSIDRIEVNSIIDSNPDIQRDKRNREMVFRLLSRADSRYTREAIENLSAMIIDAILLEYEMQEDSRFLLPILNRKSSGLRATLRRRDSSS